MTDETPRRDYKIDGDVARARSSLGGIARAASQSPEERSEAARKAVNARWAKHRAERQAEGVPATKKPPVTPIDDSALEFWRQIVLAEQPDRVWTSAQQLKRAAISRARQDVARATLAAARNRGAE